MEKKMELKIGVCFLALSLCLPVISSYANQDGTFSGESAQSPSVRSIPVTGENDALPAVVSPPAPSNGVVDSMEFVQEALVLQPSASPAPVDPQGHDTPGADLSEQAIGGLVDSVVSEIVNAGFGPKLSEVFVAIGSGDPAGLVNVHQNNPAVLDQLITSIDGVSQKHSGDAPSQEYLDNWSKEAKAVRDELLQYRQGRLMPDPLVAKLTKLYQPIARRISEIAKGFESVSTSWGSRTDNGSEPSSADLLRGFSEKAKQFIVDSVIQAQSNLEDGVLSNPLGTTAFAAETAPGFMPGDVLGVRKMTVAEMYIKSQLQKYQVTDSIFIGNDFIRTQKMLHPPANLHPYLKWLLYTRNLTPRMMENYLATREAILDIYGQAKAGHGNIRYRGKVYGAFLPFAETAAGNYELVKPAPAE